MTLPAVFLMGPTASGKTGLALALAEAVERGGLPVAGVALISVDSAQVYRGMDIGTAKPPRATLARWPHALIDVIDPAESYSVARFVSEATACVQAARAADQLPVLVGGTGLYFRALAEGLSDLPEADADWRAALAAEAQGLGWPALHARLAALDAPAAAKIKPNDAQRIARALEIHALTGKSRSAHWDAARRGGLPGPIIKFGLLPADRTRLHAKIGERFLRMMDEGFLDEVRGLKARSDLHARLPSMRAVGYRQLMEHLQGECGLDVAIERGIAATRQYAKRQITWLRSERELRGLDSASPEAALAQVIGQLQGSGLR